MQPSVSSPTPCDKGGRRVCLFMQMRPMITKGDLLHNQRTVACILDHSKPEDALSFLSYSPGYRF